MSRERSGHDHPVLMVGLSNPATVSRLVRLSSLLAGTGPFDVLLTHVVEVASQISLTSGRASPETVRARDFLSAAVQEAESHGVDARALVEVARSVEEGLVAASGSRRAALMLVGYSEQEDRARGGDEKRFDRTMHRVARSVSCDVVVAKFRREELGTVLVPLVAESRLRLTGLLCRAVGSLEGTRLRFLHLAPPGVGTEDAVRRMQEALSAEALSGLGALETVVTDRVVDTVAERAADQDLVIVGPAHPSGLVEAIFGTAGERIAERVTSSVLLARAGEGK